MTRKIQRVKMCETKNYTIEETKQVFKNLIIELYIDLGYYTSPHSPYVKAVALAKSFVEAIK